MIPADTELDTGAALSRLTAHQLSASATSGPSSAAPGPRPQSTPPPPHGEYDLTTPTHPLTPRGRQLIARAHAAAEIRGWQTHPDVAALAIERKRALVDRLIWVGIIIGLCFTMANVHDFATGATVTHNIGWWAAWLLDPAVSIMLLGILIAEREAARRQLVLSWRAQAAKWVLLAGTYVMNTWAVWSTVNAAGIILHSIPPLAVFAAAEAVTDLQDKLTACVTLVHEVTTRHPQTDTDRHHIVSDGSVSGTVMSPQVKRSTVSDFPLALHSEIMGVADMPRDPLDTEPDISDTSAVTADESPDTVSSPVTVLPDTVSSPVTVLDDVRASTRRQRHQWIITRLGEGHDVTGPDVETRFGITNGARDVRLAKATLASPRRPLGTRREAR